jgi:hypothetical protein
MAAQAKIIEALGLLVAYLETLDPAKYNPTNTNLTIDALQDLRAAADASMQEASDALAVWRTKAKDRALLIEKMPVLAAQAVNLFASNGADKERVKQAQTYLRKLQGKRAAPAVADNPDTPDVDESQQSISASQKSAAQMIANFRALVDFLQAQAEYQSVNVAGLKPAELNAFADQVEASHNESINAAAQVTSKRANRTNLISGDDDSIVKRAAAVKNFVFAVYGAKSVEYKTVKGFKF